MGGTVWINELMIILTSFGANRKTKYSRSEVIDVVRIWWNRCERRNLLWRGTPTTAFIHTNAAKTGTFPACSTGHTHSIGHTQKKVTPCWHACGGETHGRSDRSATGTHTGHGQRNQCQLNLLSRAVMRPQSVMILPWHTLSGLHSLTHTQSVKALFHGHLSYIWAYYRCPPLTPGLVLYTAMSIALCHHSQARHAILFHWVSQHLLKRTAKFLDEQSKFLK